MKTFLSIAVVVIVAGGFFVWTRAGASVDETPSYRVAKAAKQDLTVRISASGTIEPEEIVDVGAQIAGKIIAFGAEPESEKSIDYGSRVEPGTVLARIDDSLYAAEVQLARSAFHQAEHQLRNAESGVAQANANVRRSQADVVRLQAELTQSEQTYRRTSALRQTQSVTDQELELVETARNIAKAQFSVGEASVEQAQAAQEMAQIAVGEARAKVEGAQALLRKAEKNLEYTTIRSPIRGVIVDRRVNIGQTVVSNLNAPSLFLIAKDLRRLEVWASVNEADIGAMRVGLPVEFTVDAYPGEVFHGTVKQVRLNATMTQSVVTYTVVVAVDNESGKLLPYLTANVRFVVAERANTLTIPTAAVRWKPRPDQVVESHREQFAARLAQASKKGGKRDGSVAVPSSRATVWVVEGKLVRPVEIETGLADASQVEVVSGPLKEGSEVVIGEAAAAKKDTKNPFAPSLTKGGP